MEKMRLSLEKIYKTYNKREFVHPDPLEFLYHYDDPSDREVAGVVAASLAYGNVKQILKAVNAVLCVMGPHPRRYLDQTRYADIKKSLSCFKYRFTTGREMADFLCGVGKVAARHGSLQRCVENSYRDGDANILGAMSAFMEELRSAGGDVGTLVPDPKAKSPLKRMNLYFRWMVRRDAVDPGGWDRIPASKLLVPLDVHMHRIASGLGLTKRAPADIRTAAEITAAFARFSPEDPVKYDFCLTRFGIRDELDPSGIEGYKNN